MSGVIEASGGVVHWLEAADGTRLRVAGWAGDGDLGERGTVLLLNGRTEYIEKYLETVADWRARGFGVWTMDWRGQGLSTRPLADPLKHYVGSFDTYLDDAELVLEQLVLPGLVGKLVLMAHSMGGHLGARLLARRPALFARAVLCSPMIDFLRGGPALRMAVRFLFRVGCLVPGKAEAFGPGQRARPSLDRPFAGNALTSDPARYAEDMALLRARPELQLGGCTWGWLRAATASIAVLLREGTVRRIELPVLLAVGMADRVVDAKAVGMFAGRLAQGRLLEIGGAEHELLRETDAHRAVLWAAIDGFMGEIR